MAKVKWYPILLFAWFFSCTNNGKSPSEIIGIEKQNNFDAPIFKKTGIVFKGNSIYFEKGEKEKIVVQEIEQKRGDVKFRAKRVDTESYLINKGIKKEELAKALTDLKGEQLFYIEFEEAEKRDLMKKYFTANMDKSVSYLSFNIDKDFQIVNGTKDTLTSNYSLYERNYHVAPFERILLSFNGLVEGEELELIYKDRLFDKGEFHFYFPSQNYIIKNIYNTL